MKHEESDFDQMDKKEALKQIKEGVTKKIKEIINA